MRILIIPLAFVIFSNCDPALSGDLKIYNNTDHVLTVKYKQKHTGDSDTSFIDVQPGKSEVIRVLGGLGNKKQFDCCSCYSGVYSIRSSLGYIKKDPELEGNWSIPNKSKLKKFGKEPVKCEFHVSQQDL